MEYYGIPFREPANHDFDFELLVRAVVAAKRLSAVASYTWRLTSPIPARGRWTACCASNWRRRWDYPRADFSALLAAPISAADLQRYRPSKMRPARASPRPPPVGEGRPGPAAIGTPRVFSVARRAVSGLEHGRYLTRFR